MSRGSLDGRVLVAVSLDLFVLMVGLVDLSHARSLDGVLFLLRDDDRVNQDERVLVLDLVVA